MDLFPEESSKYLEDEIEKTKPIVLISYGYQKEKIYGKKFVNGNFEIIEKLGEGSFWNVYKVERSVNDENINHKSIHIFKEGSLGFIYPDDEITEEVIYQKGLVEETNMKKFDETDIYNVKENCLNDKKTSDLSDLDRKYSNENIQFDQRLALKELFILRKVNHKNIVRLYECIIDESIDKIVFVMEFCNLGQLMIYNSDQTGYEYNKNFIIFLLEKYFFQDYKNQRKVILDLVNFKKDKQNLINENEILEKFESLIYNQSKEDNLVENYIFDLFEKNFKLKVYFSKKILQQIIEAVKYLHSHNICNRDIKPENIVIKGSFKDKNHNISEAIYCNSINDDFIKLTDFSISKIYDDKNLKIMSFAGSDLFKSPEMLNFEYFNPFKAEIYSIGVTIIYFLFKKLYKPTSIKQMNEEDKEKILENKIIESNNNFFKQNSKLLMMRSNSFFNRPRKSSIIFSNFEKLNRKDFITNFEETKAVFEEINEIQFYNLIKTLIADNPEERLDIENFHNIF